jgi:N utilization substance protein B
MQAVHAYERQEDDNIQELEKFLNQSMTDVRILLLYMLQLLVKIHEAAEDRLEKGKKKHLATEEDLNPSRNFVNHGFLKFLATSEVLKEELKKRKLKPWSLEFKYVNNLLDEIQQSDHYKEFQALEQPSQKQEVKFISALYADNIAPRQEIIDFLEDENITWIDDYPLVNSTLLKMFNKTKPKTHQDIRIPDLFKSQDDAKFAMDLFRKTINNRTELNNRIEGKTPNWDKDRIAQLDIVLIMMAQCELLYFPSIPIKVTINEYLDISREYSSPKSANFINGILDTLLRELSDNGMINKVGRGLM